MFCTDVYETMSRAQISLFVFSLSSAATSVNYHRSRGIQNLSSLPSMLRRGGNAFPMLPCSPRCSGRRTKVRNMYLSVYEPRPHASIPAFADMLNRMRLGDLNADMIAQFTALSREVTYEDGIEPTELYAPHHPLPLLETHPINLQILPPLRSRIRQQQPPPQAPFRPRRIQILRPPWHRLERQNRLHHHYGKAPRAHARHVPAPAQSRRAGHVD